MKNWKRDRSTTSSTESRVFHAATGSYVRRNLVLAICCASVVLVGMDITIVNVALPTIQRDLHASIAGLQWIIDAYMVVAASLLIFSGSAADRFGRKFIFQIGLVLFSAASLLCSVAHSIEGLIFFRAVQGLGASMLTPVALSIIANVFPQPKDRARAVGVWGAVAGLALALGPILGGALSEYVGWRFIFWVNLPVTLVTIALVARFVPESKSQQARAFDPVGETLVFAGLAALTYAIIEGPRSGWTSGLILGLLLSAGVTLILFLLYEPRRIDPLIDLRFFQSVPFSSAAILAAVTFASFGAFLFLNALYLQQARGLSALETGLSMFPLALMMMIFAPLSGRSIARHGTRPSLLAAGVGFMTSTLILTHLNRGTSVLLLMLAYTLFGAALGMANTAITDTAVAGMPLSQAGVAAAIVATEWRVGMVLGVAVAGTVVSAGRSSGSAFAQATHPIWWIMAAAGAAVLVLGWLSSTPRAKASGEKVAELLSDTSHPMEDSQPELQLTG
jgi:EmrB/QacA subfamily drug resistance transporter